MFMVGKLIVKFHYPLQVEYGCLEIPSNLSLYNTNQFHKKNVQIHNPKGQQFSLLLNVLSSPSEHPAASTMNSRILLCY